MSTTKLTKQETSLFNTNKADWLSLQHLFELLCQTGQNIFFQMIIILFQFVRFLSFIIVKTFLLCHNNDQIWHFWQAGKRIENCFELYKIIVRILCIKPFKIIPKKLKFILKIIQDVPITMSFSASISQGSQILLLTPFPPRHGLFQKKSHTVGANLNCAQRLQL